ncbi:hypothetical protein TorRG33x02_225890 [Trema orientale]|uniref:Uncharacterized protein n=1 Tax=Trema orientale TaxID=63057 RepID=A0A2P5E7X0_TREOI|nr:hypothetical protein TorRG33x02_225890 [Trema orientale]
MGRVLRVSVEVVLRAVPAMEQVSEVEGRGSVPEEWSGGEVEDLVEGFQAVEPVDHGVDLGWVGVVSDLEENDVLDGLSHCYLGGESARIGYEGKRGFGFGVEEVFGS